MAKRNCKKSLKNRKRQSERSILSKQSNESCVLLETSSPISSLNPIPVHSLTPSPSIKSPSDRVSCTCEARFPKQLTLQLLDESTTDGSDITWEDQSRHFCVCPKGKAGNRVREILSTLPSVDTPSSKQKKLSLGGLMSVVEGSDTGLNHKSKLRDSRNVLQNLLQQIKSPVHSAASSHIHSNTALPLQMSANNDNQCSIECNSKNHTPDVQQELDTTAAIQTINTKHLGNANPPIEVQVGSINELLPSDFDVLEDLAIFSPLPNANSNHTPSEQQSNNHSAHIPTVSKTPLRKLSSLRKRLVTMETESPVRMDHRDIGDGNNAPECGNQQKKSISKELVDDHDEEDEELLFWSQVADKVVDYDSTTASVTATTGTITTTTGTIRDIVPVTTDIVPVTTYDDVMMNDELFFNCMSSDNEEVFIQEATVWDNKDLSNGPQPRNHIGKVYSQQDIDAKRLLAKKKLQQKFKSI